MQLGYDAYRGTQGYLAQNAMRRLDTTQGRRYVDRIELRRLWSLGTLTTADLPSELLGERIDLESLLRKRQSGAWAVRQGRIVVVPHLGEDLWALNLSAPKALTDTAHERDY